MSELRRLPVLHQEIDSTLGADRRGRCGECTEPWCCNLVAMVALSEALLIVDHLLEQPDGERTVERLVQAANAQMVQLSDWHYTRESWWAEQNPCVFLKDKRCSIYEVRPVSCRAHVTTEHPSRCGPDWKEPIAYLNSLPTSMKLDKVDTPIMAELGLDPYYGPLAEAFLFARSIRMEGVAVFRRKLEYAIENSEVPWFTRWFHLVRTDSQIPEGFLCETCGLPRQVSEGRERCVRCGARL